VEREREERMRTHSHIKLPLKHHVDAIWDKDQVKLAMPAKTTVQTIMGPMLHRVYGFRLKGENQIR
jgi:hypothetical protein